MLSYIQVFLSSVLIIIPAVLTYKKDRKKLYSLWFFVCTVVGVLLTTVNNLQSVDKANQSEINARQSQNRADTSENRLHVATVTYMKIAEKSLDMEDSLRHQIGILTKISMKKKG